VKTWVVRVPTCHPRTVTPFVSRTSRVRGMSRMLFAPAHTVSTGVRDRSARSAETSIVASTPRCTPPIPPVTKTEIPAIPDAITAVPDTVVAADLPSPTATARSRREALENSCEFSASCCSSWGSSPTLTPPAKIAIVAGVAPCSRTTRSTASAVSRFAGKGIPWATIVLSNATTPRPVHTQ
jgi:hypothetical protein